MKELVVINESNTMKSNYLFLTSISVNHFKNQTLIWHLSWDLKTEKFLDRWSVGIRALQTEGMTRGHFLVTGTEVAQDDSGGSRIMPSLVNHVRDLRF